MKWLSLAVFGLFLAAVQAKICADCPADFFDNALDEEDDVPDEQDDVPDEQDVQETKASPEEGDVKLMYGNKKQGAAMMFKNGQWGTICDQKGFKPRGWASVFCRQLHGEGWEAVDVEFVRDLERDDRAQIMEELKQYPLSFEKPNCFPHSTETMSDCPKNNLDDEEYCQRGHEQDCWVKCAQIEEPGPGPCPQDGTLRLVDKDGVVNDVQGRAEIFIDGYWGTICDSKGFSTKGWAAVFCKQLLGYASDDRYVETRDVQHVADMPGFEGWAQRDFTRLPINFHVPNCFARNTSSMLDCGHNWKSGIEKCARINNKGDVIFKGHEWDVWIKC